MTPPMLVLVVRTRRRRRRHVKLQGGTEKPRQQALVAAGKPPRTRPKRLNTNRARERMRQEIVDLRKTATQLEALLAALQGGERVPAALLMLTKSKQTMTMTTRHPHANASLWETLALRQLLQRERAEAENARLKESLRNQIRLTQNQTLLFKRSKCQISDERDAWEKRFCAMAAQDAAALDDMLSELDDLFLQTDAIFEMHDMYDMEEDKTIAHTSSSSLMHSRLPFGMCIRIVDVAVFPFDAHRTGQAMWEFSAVQARDPRLTIYTALESTQDTRAITLNAPVEVDGKLINVRARQVLRKYFERNRVVFVFVKNTMPEWPANFAYEWYGQSWARIQPLSTNPNACVIQYLSTVVPRPREGGTDRANSTEQLIEQIQVVSDFIIDSFKGGAIHLRENLENILLEQTRLR
ncbi:TPA: hypothetical protein N0F65_011183 [Lagenidium giganteum]|uniref:Uncharacterized protein n=1 Tax=Lagenidium giganteum TaxID=4803 RepID=A0AAV2Z733_9STRA|nr:TPA: hypothetical protein N0F65_011183 [Lagenidium giganteum]